MKHVILFLTCLLLSTSAFSQVGIGTENPDASAVLDLTSTTQGLLPPRMIAAQRDAIGTPAQGLMIYCTDCGANGQPQLYNGAAWVNLVGGDAAVPTPRITTLTGRIWMDRNLGATRVAQTVDDHLAYGDLYQWGRGADGHQLINSATTTTLSSTDQPAHGDFILAPNSPFDWRSSQNDNLWQEVNGVNNPCPAGFRLPTITEITAEVNVHPITNSDSAFESPLKFTVPGKRNFSSGALVNVGTHGYYWSSSLATTRVFFAEGTVGLVYNRAYGFTVRCIKD